MGSHSASLRLPLGLTHTGVWVRGRPSRLSAPSLLTSAPQQPRPQPALTARWTQPQCHKVCTPFSLGPLPLPHSHHTHPWVCVCVAHMLVWFVVGEPLLLLGGVCHKWDLNICRESSHLCCVCGSHRAVPHHTDLGLGEPPAICCPITCQTDSQPCTHMRFTSLPASAARLQGGFAVLSSQATASSIHQHLREPCLSLCPSLTLLLRQ